MNALQFESTYGSSWDELEAALRALQGPRKRRKPFDPPWAAPPAPPDRARVAALYRSACEHLALAQAREYPVSIVERLERLTQQAHQVVYRRSDSSIGRVAQLFLLEIPRAVRAHRMPMLVALLVFALPLVGSAIGAALDPGFALSIHSAEELRSYENMYGGRRPAPLGVRPAGSDFQMLGYYIMNNIGIAFRTFAGGLFFGVGALLVLLFNGLYAGTVAGHLSAQGLGENFYAFVITHGAFELTAIVLAGGAGLVIGHSLLAPGRRTRLAALRESALAVVPVLYGVFALLVVAAVVEAFWSSAPWVAHEVKFGVGGLCWGLVLGWLLWQGRARPRSDAR